MPDPITVLVVGGFRGAALPSGEEIAIQSHLKTLAACPQIDADSLLIRKPEKEGLFAQFLGLFWSFSMVKLLREKCRQALPKVVHFHSIYPMVSFAPLWACRKLGIKTVVTLHNLRFICAEGAYYRNGNTCNLCIKGMGVPSLFFRCVQGSWLKTLLFFLANTFFVRFKFGLRWADHFVAVSPFIKAQYLRLGIPDSKISILPIAVPPFHGAAPASFDRKTIVFAGRLSVEKGLAVFLELCRHFPEYQFIAIGPLLSDLPLSSLSNLELLGTRSHEETLHIIHTRASLVIIPSICSESYNLTAHEALALGIPILTSRFGNLPDLVHASQAGVSVTIFDLTTVAAAIVAIHSDEESYQKMQDSGMAYIQNTLGNQALAADYLALYSQLAATLCA